MFLYLLRSSSSNSSNTLLLSEKCRKSLISCIVVFFNILRLIKIPFLLMLYFSLLIFIILKISFNSYDDKLTSLFLISTRENFIV